MVKAITPKCQNHESKPPIPSSRWITSKNTKNMTSKNCWKRQLCIDKNLSASFQRTPTRQNMSKEYPNSNDMMGRFLRIGLLWLRHVNNSRSFAPRRRLGDKCKAQWAELKQQPFTPKSAGDSETNVQNSLGPQRTFEAAKATCCKKPEKKPVILPWDLY